MDPNANLRDMRAEASAILESLDSNCPIDPDDAAHLAELVQALDAWILRGGFLPADWQEVES